LEQREGLIRTEDDDLLYCSFVSNGESSIANRQAIQTLHEFSGQRKYYFKYLLADKLGRMRQAIVMKPDRRSTLQCDTIIGDSELVAAKVSDSEIALVLCPSRSLDLKAGAAEIVLRQEIFLTS
jgi:hypothetical protein